MGDTIDNTGEREVALLGGRMTPGIVRVGDTVRRPTGPHSPWVHRLLQHLEQVGFEAAPRFLGVDAKGRTILEFIAGDVPIDLGIFSEASIVGGAKLLRGFHDATANTAICDGSEVICHGDASPCNAVFVGELPVALIDFDTAYPGERLDDVGYAAWAWIDLGNPSRSVPEAAALLGKFCRGYALLDTDELVPAILRAQRRMLRACDLTVDSGHLSAATARWCQACLTWTQAASSALNEAAETCWDEF